MSVVEEAINKARELKVRMLNTIDAFRPKLLIKKPLTEIRILGEERLSGEGISTFMNRIKYRIENLRRAVGIHGETEIYTETPSTSTVSSQVTEVLESKKKKKVAIHY